MWLQFLLSVLAGALFIISLRYFFTFGAWLVRKIRDAVPTRYAPTESPEDEHIQILVVGDIGRSPRMQYHGISVASHGRKVDLIGYKGECSPSAFEETSNLTSRQRNGPAPSTHRKAQCCSIRPLPTARMDFMGDPSSPFHSLQSYPSVLHPLLQPNVRDSSRAVDHNSGE